MADITRRVERDSPGHGGASTSSGGADGGWLQVSAVLLRGVTP